MPKNILLTTISPGQADIQLALYYLKAYFLKNSTKSNLVNIKVTTFSRNEKLDLIISQINRFQPEIIGFSCYVWNIVTILKIAKFIKAERRQVKILLGGPEVSPRAYKILKYYSFIDVVVIGEGEETFKEFIESYLDNPFEIGKVKGIAYRRRDKVITTDRRPEISNLDTIPSPYLEGVIDMDFKSHGQYLPTETLRGCVYKCHYCYYHKEFQNIRYFSLERVESELKYLLGKKPRGIYLMDPTFNFNKERAKRILKMLIKYNQKEANLHVELRAELLDEETVGLLKKARANFIEIGIQSLNPKTLRLINRPFKPMAFKRNILLLNRNNIPYEVQLIDGLPADNYKSLKKSVDWLFGLKPCLIKIMRLMLLPGTYLRLHAKDFKIKYNSHPQYYSIQSDTFSRSDLKRTEDLRMGMTILYDTGLLRKSLYQLVAKFDISFSNILEEYNNWMHKQHNGLMRIVKGNFSEKQNIKNAVYGFALIKTANQSLNFVHFLSNKYSTPLGAELLKSVKKDRKNFLKKPRLQG